MNDHDDPKLREILDQASDLSRLQRGAFLDSACGGDAKLRGEIQSLLDSLDQAGGFLGEPTIAPAGMSSRSFQSDYPGRERAGERIGCYKLLQLIGEGGFGSVFMAEQERPVRRRVALKIIKLGMDTKQVIARFEAERQALAMMDHPNIARVLDAGTTESGRPYFVMELVKGVTITEYCNQGRLTPRQRLELFIPVCRAIQHAHQKGIIHRDLKPSNVMVTLHDGVPLPKVIDFGIAKAINQRLTEHTVFTEYRQLIGTPEYTSPEQADLSALDVDTRSDIYSLGVLLYELLTGTTPFEPRSLRRCAYDEMRRMIREVEPPKPSTRLSTLGNDLKSLVAERMATEPRRLTRVMAGELDWIVMKCLEKDRGRRYETANGLARDLERYLGDEPVEASPPSAVYRLRKLARKYRIGLVISILLVSATTISTWQAVRVTRANAVALAEKRRADQQAIQAIAARGSAELAKAEALHSAARATEMQRMAELRLAHGLVAQGDAMAEGGRWVEAKELYRQAGASLERLGQSQMPADLGLLNAYAYAPPPLLELAGHHGPVIQTAISPDGRFGASAGADGVVCVWDLVGARCKFRLIGHTRQANCVAFSRDEEMLISGSNDGTVKLWDLRTGNCLRTLSCPPGPKSVSFSGHGTYCGAANADDQSAIWEVATGRQVCRLSLDGREASCLAFSPDEKTCLLCGFRLQMKLFETSTGRLLRTIPMPFVTTAAVYSADGRAVLTGAFVDRSNGDATVLWDAETWHVKQSYDGHTARVTSVAFSPDGSHVVSASEDGTVMHWPIGSSVGAVTGIGDGHPLTHTSVSPSGSMALSGEEDGKVRLWNLWGDRAMRALHADACIWSVGISHDGTVAAAACEDGLRIWEVPSHTLLLRLGPARRRMVALSPDGRLALSSEFDSGVVHLLDVLTGKEQDLARPPGTARAAAFSADGKWMAWGDGCTAYVADVATRQIRTTIRPDMTMAESLSFSSDDLLLRSATSHGTAYLWLLPSGLQVPTLAWLQNRRELNGNVVFARHSGIAAAGNANRLLVWNTISGTLLAPLEGHRGVIEHVAISPDGQWIASGALDGLIKVWNLNDLREARTLAGFGAVHGLCWSADGRVLLSGSGDGNAIAWQVNRPAEYRRLLPQLTTAIASLATNPDDTAALQTLATWYAFRGQDDWAAEITTRVRQSAQMK